MKHIRTCSKMWPALAADTTSTKGTSDSTTTTNTGPYVKQVPYCLPLTLVGVPYVDKYCNLQM